MYARFQAWLERRAQRHAAYLAAVRRASVATYSFRWALIVAAISTVLLALDFYHDKCCSRSLIEVIEFAAFFRVLFGVPYFFVTYVGLRFELRHYRDNAP